MNNHLPNYEYDMNARQIKAYHELMDYIDRQNYKVLMRDKKGKFEINPSFNYFHRQKVIGFDQRLKSAVKDIISQNQLSNEEVLELEGFIKCSSYHVNEAYYDDLYLPQLLTLLGAIIIFILSFSLFFIDCDIDIINILFDHCFDRASFYQKIFTYLVGLYIAALMFAAVRRRTIMMKISNHKLLIAEHLRNYSRRW